jgi:hypothetical protein
MQNINLSIKYLDHITQDIYLDINLLSTMPCNDHTKSVINHLQDRVNLLEKFVHLLTQFYQNELQSITTQEEI